MKINMARRPTPALASANSMVFLFRNAADTSPSIFLKGGEMCMVNLLSRP